MTINSRAPGGRLRYGAVALVLALAGCGDGDPGPGEAATPSYAGQRIMVIAPKLNAGLISGPILEQAQRFSERTGAEVRVVTPGWNETVEEIRESLEDPLTGSYDLFVITTSWSGLLFEKDAVAEIPQWVQDKVDWQDILPIYRDNILTWSRRPYALPYDGDVVTLYYRKDLFENPEHAARFEAEYGHPLAPPATWEQYHQIARFFTGWDWDGDGAIEYGLVGNRKPNGSAMLIFLARAAAYAKHPDDPAYYFDPATMRPRIASPGFVRALEEYVGALAFGPPGMANFAGNDVRASFVSGNAAMAIDWANIGIEAVNNPVSVVRGKVGYAQLPGADRVYDERGGRWEDRLNRASAMVGNYLFLVNRNATHIDLAFEFAAEMTAPALTKRLTTEPASGVNPSRESHLNDPGSWQAHGFDTESAAGYLATIREALSNRNYIFDIRIPGSERYYRALDGMIYRALKGEITPKAALEQAAQEWERITGALGRKRQIELYQASLNE